MWNCRNFANRVVGLTAEMLLWSQFRYSRVGTVARTSTLWRQLNRQLISLRLSIAQTLGGNGFFNLLFVMKNRTKFERLPIVSGSSSIALKLISRSTRLVI